MHVLVTGGTGFIGKKLLNRLIQKKYKITALVRECSENKIFKAENISWIIGDLDSFEAISLIDIDIVIHLAAFSPNKPYASVNNCIKQNVLVPTKFIETMIDKGVKNWFIAGTYFEKKDFTVFENSLNSYTLSKSMLNLLVRYYTVKYGLKSVYGIIHQVYGDGEPNDRLWHNLKKAAEGGEDFVINSGKQNANFISVDNVVDQIIKSFQIFDNLDKGVFVEHHIKGHKELSVSKFAQNCWSSWGASGKLIIKD